MEWEAQVLGSNWPGISFGFKLLLSAGWLEIQRFKVDFFSSLRCLWCLDLSWCKKVPRRWRIFRQERYLFGTAWLDWDRAKMQQTFSLQEMLCQLCKSCCTFIALNELHSVLTFRSHLGAIVFVCWPFGLTCDWLLLHFWVFVVALKNKSFIILLWYIIVYSWFLMLPPKYSHELSSSLSLLLLSTLSSFASSRRHA